MGAAAAAGSQVGTFRRIGQALGLSRAQEAADRRRGPSVPVPHDRRQIGPGEPAPKHHSHELRNRLMGMAHSEAVNVMQHLVLVHDLLARQGWAAVGELPATVLGRALLQCEILASEGSSPTLEAIIDRLRHLQAQAARRDEFVKAAKESLPEIRVGDNLEVTESTFAEYDMTERSWAGTVPAELDPAIAAARQEA
jgi:hypothetical protein